MNNETRVYISLNDWYDTFALEIELISKQDFLKVMETLTRIGILNNIGKKLFQSCHIYQKRGKYYIVHFKEMFALDGKGVNISKDDLGRRNTIACLLEEWGMINIMNPDMMGDNKIPVSSLTIIKHSDVSDYELIAKYQIGTKKRRF